jgi:malonate transporter and related proteins
MAVMIIEALVPIFFVIFLGYFAGARRIINNQHVASLTVLLLTFAVPVAAFVGIAQTSRSGLEENGKLVFVLVISMLVIFGITFAINHYVFRLSPGENAVQSLSVGFPNFPAVGLPLLGSLMGPGSAVSVAFCLAAGSIFISPLTLAVLEARGKATSSSPDLVVNALFCSVSKPVVIAPVAGLVAVILGIHVNGVVSHALNLIGATTAGLACFVTGLVLSAQPLRLNANVGVCVFLKNIGLPLVAYAITLALGMSGQIARETILLAALPAGFVGILFGLNYGVRSQALGSTLTLSSLVSVITLTAAILLTSQMK